MENDLKDVYIGERANQQKNGFGVYKFRNGFYRYEGNWKDGKKHGHGKLVMADGSFYEGSFDQGEITGSGVKHSALQRSDYSGEFLNGEYNGSGVIKYARGGGYEGEWQRNQYHGRGRLTYPSGEVFEGEFHCHKRHGRGQMRYSNGDHYDGDWIRDKRQGQGCLEAADGSIYEGQFFNDMYHGQGRMAHCSGIVYDGLWSGNKPVNRAGRIIISNHLHGALHLTQGEPFSLEVEVLSEDGQVMHVESGRQLQVFAGFQDHRPANGGSLFHQIEDIAEEPLQTPFGYQVVEFPLSESTAYQAFLEAEAAAAAAAATAGTTEQEEQPAQPETGGEKAAASATELESANNPTAAPRVAGAPAVGEDDPSGAATFRVYSPPPPPPGISTVATLEGRASFADLVLPRPHSLYRPYAALDERDGAVILAPASAAAPAGSTAASLSMGGAAATAAAVASATSAKKKKGRDKDEDSRLRQKRLGDERFARPGEYVLCVRDVSQPAFPAGDSRPEPAFLRLVLAAPALAKEAGGKEKEVKEKEKKKQWNTQAMIASVVAQSSTQQATGELEKLRGEPSSS
ncbi:hypothetical protein BOX15_Mlig029097g2 [Macrostomum lignano]|uniref:Uncharacterized protein n=2 Tax=Macrostomum lignano TaxID=282301 RepID=A0A267DJB8_9PLAT|nr:hypothetical protein BOX15_Mlig029097g3 [Macrostomum lignano]PAA49393.1 hypothetical protein BOX15_Mlig029097g2 [Macrostomum lignano]